MFKVKGKWEDIGIQQEKQVFAANFKPILRYFICKRYLK